MSILTVCLLIVGVAIKNCAGHGMMLDPPNRGSLWRFNKSFPINYDDNQNFCGGFGVQYYTYGGKCGACGDSYGDKVPRSNENTGTYGLGYIAAKYPKGSAVNVTIRLTANHKGTFTYSLCKLVDRRKPEQEKCFKNLLLADGSKQYNVKAIDFTIVNTIRLPKNITCKQCVLRWNYRAGNNWGVCDNGQGAMGCGPQETFRTCTDIAIY